MNTVSPGSTRRGCGHREPFLGVDVYAQALSERVLVRREPGRDGAAVRALRETLAIELAEIATNRHRGDLELLLEVSD